MIISDELEAHRNRVRVAKLTELEHLSKSMGWLYLMTNEMFSNIVKIGMTRFPKKRQKSMSDGIPPAYPQWHIVWKKHIKDLRKKETYILTSLDEYRIENTEFLELEINDAIRRVKELLSPSTPTVGL